MDVMCLMSHRMGATPIDECRYTVLGYGDTLVVEMEFGKELINKYGIKLLCVGFQEQESLANGKWELRHYKMGEPLGKNRSMQGSTKVKSK